MKTPVLAAAVAGLAALAAAPAASAWVLTLTPGPEQLFLMVGVGTPAASNAAINTVSVNVPAGGVGNGTPQAMTSDSTQSASPYDNYAVCNPPAQVYVGGSYRPPNATTGAANATLQLSTPASLSSGADSIPFSQISWTSTANGNAAADIPAGAFNGGTLLLANIGRNAFVENCFSNSYANAAVVPSGTYAGRATFTLAVPWCRMHVDVSQAVGTLSLARFAFDRWDCESELHAHATPGALGETDRCVVQGGDVENDGQAKAAAFTCSRPAADKTLEHRCALVLVDARPGIRNAHEHGVGEYLDHYATAGGRVTDSVVDQVAQRLGDQVRNHLSEHRAWGSEQFEINALGKCVICMRCTNILCQCDQIMIAKFQVAYGLGIKPSER